jgi:hypothetical protein
MRIRIGNNPVACSEQSSAHSLICIFGAQRGPWVEVNPAVSFQELREKIELSPRGISEIVCSKSFFLLLCSPFLESFGAYVHTCSCLWSLVVIIEIRGEEGEDRHFVSRHLALSFTLSFQNYIVYNIDLVEHARVSSWHGYTN